MFYTQIVRTPAGPTLIHSPCMTDHKKIAGLRIKAARKAMGLSGAKLASLVPGLTPSALGNYEQGTRYPSPSILTGLAKALKEPASYLGALDDDQGLVTLSRTYVRLDERGKTTIHRVAESQPSEYSSGPQNEVDKEQARKAR